MGLKQLHLVNKRPRKEIIVQLLAISLKLTDMKQLHLVKIQRLLQLMQQLLVIKLKLLVLRRMVRHLDMQLKLPGNIQPRSVNLHMQLGRVQ